MNSKDVTDSKLISIDGDVKLNVEIIGNGPPMLCYSGFACSNFNFTPLSTYLKEHFTLYMIDNRGFGKSDLATTDYNFDQLAFDGMKLMKKLNISYYTVAGISLGGFIAQRHTLLFPQNVSNLILLSTKSSGPEYPITSEITEDSFTKFCNLDPEVGNRLAIEAFVHPSFKGTTACEQIVELRSATNPIVLSQALRQLRATWKFIENIQPLHEIECPCLIIHGDNDTFLIPENASILQRYIKNSQLHFIKDTAHLFFFEKPKEVSEIIKSFLKES